MRPTPCSYPARLLHRRSGVCLSDLAIALSFACFLLLAEPVCATPFTLNAVVGGAPTGVTYANFDNLPSGNVGGVSGGIGVSFTGAGMAYQGNTSSVAPPYLSNGNGTLFGNPANGLDLTEYLVAGAGDTFTLGLPAEERYLGLLWGSVDSYNTLSFYDGTTLVGSITGSDVTSGSFGDRGVNGTYYVNINSTLPFDRVVALSSGYSFEVDNVAYNPAPVDFSPVPEPLTAEALTAGLSFLGFVVLRRRAAASTDPPALPSPQ